MNLAVVAFWVIIFGFPLFLANAIVFGLGITRFVPSWLMITLLVLDIILLAALVLVFFWSIWWWSSYKPKYDKYYITNRELVDSFNSKLREKEGSRVVKATIVSENGKTTVINT
jgi:hypothetical protein